MTDILSQPAQLSTSQDTNGQSITQSAQPTNQTNSTLPQLDAQGHTTDPNVTAASLTVDKSQIPRQVSQFIVFLDLLLTPARC